MRLTRTLRFSQRNLPHWEVEGGRYFVTVRCADSLPADVVARLAEFGRALKEIEPRSESFAEMQRCLFAALDRSLDAGFGECPLRDPAAATKVADELEGLTEAWGVAVPHYSILPNHWHALIVPPPDGSSPLSAIIKRVKGRSACELRRAIGGSGPVWQREWFDRWIRDEAEWGKCVAYIRNNPVRAGLARTWVEHLWTK